MSVRRNTNNRRYLVRQCGVCGKRFSTTADTPWLRQVKRDGQQLSTYYCSEQCYKDSYVHIGWYDGLSAQRKKEREANRDRTEENRRYYAKHRDAERERSKQAYYAMSQADRDSLNEYRRKVRAVGGIA